MEVKNADVGPSQLLIKFVGSPALGSLDGDHIKYHLLYEDGNKNADFSNSIYKKDYGNELEWKHDLP